MTGKTLADLQMSDMAAEEMARQMTLYVHQRIIDADIRDFFRKRFFKAEKVQAVINHFNELVEMVVTEIVSCSDLKQRGKKLTFFIQAAHHCRLLNNFHSMMGILVALNNASVSRLANTWNEVAAKERERFEELDSLMSMLQNYKAYREEYSITPTPKIPFFGVLISDLTFIEEGNPKFISRQTAETSTIIVTDTGASSSAPATDTNGLMDASSKLSSERGSPRITEADGDTDMSEQNLSRPATPAMQDKDEDHASKEEDDGEHELDGPRESHSDVEGGSMKCVIAEESAENSGVNGKKEDFLSLEAEKTVSESEKNEDLSAETIDADDLAREKKETEQKRDTDEKEEKEEEEAKLMNFMKRQMMVFAIRQILEAQSSVYHLERLEFAQLLLSRAKRLSEKAAYNLSLECEPRTTKGAGTIKRVKQRPPKPSISRTENPLFMVHAASRDRLSMMKADSHEDLIAAGISASQGSPMPAPVAETQSAPKIAFRSPSERNKSSLANLSPYSAGDDQSGDMSDSERAKIQMMQRRSRRKSRVGETLHQFIRKGEKEKKKDDDHGPESHRSADKDAIGQLRM